MYTSVRETYKPVVGDIYVSVSLKHPEMFVVAKLHPETGFYYLWLLSGELRYSPANIITGWNRL